MVRSISWKILPEIFGKIDETASARNVISETRYDFLLQVKHQHFIGQIWSKLGQSSCKFLIVIFVRVEVRDRAISPVIWYQLIRGFRYSI